MNTLRIPMNTYEYLWIPVDTYETYEYRTKVFIGINIREIRDCQNRERFSSIKNFFHQVLDTWNNTEDEELPKLGVEPATHRLQIELHRHWLLCTKTLSWIAKHWSCEYREKTTPSQTFMPCNLVPVEYMNKYLLYINEKKNIILYHKK